MCLGKMVVDSKPYPVPSQILNNLITFSEFLIIMIINPFFKTEQSF